MKDLTKSREKFYQEMQQYEARFSQIREQEIKNVEELFTTNMGYLRTKRKKADYENKNIGKFEANESLRLSNEVIEILTKFFTI